MFVPTCNITVKDPVALKEQLDILGLVTQHILLLEGGEGQAGAISNNMGQAGVISDNMGEAGVISDNMGQAGAISDNMGQAGAISDNMGQAGAISDNMEEAGVISDDMGEWVQAHLQDDRQAPRASLTPWYLVPLEAVQAPQWAQRTGAKSIIALPPAAGPETLVRLQRLLTTRTTLGRDTLGLQWTWDERMDHNDLRHTLLHLKEVTLHVSVLLLACPCLSADTPAAPLDTRLARLKAALRDIPLPKHVAILFRPIVPSQDEGPWLHAWQRMLRPCHVENIDILLPMTDLFPTQATSGPTTRSDTVAQRFFRQTCQSDRPDGLLPTIVVEDPAVGGRCLGLVYSSADSLANALAHQRGIYWSRKRKALWRKGDSSGAIQQLLRVETDCDADCLRFVVRQAGAGFCHFERRSCFPSWPEKHGPAVETLSTLMETIKARVSASSLSTTPAAPATRSYTQRLATEPGLLPQKILEEALEFVEAANDPTDTTQHVAEEAGDVLYFLLVQCAVRGVSLKDVMAVLGQRRQAAKAPSTHGTTTVSATPRRGDAKLDLEKRLGDALRRFRSMSAPTGTQPAATASTAERAPGPSCLMLRQATYDPARTDASTRRQLVARPHQDPQSQAHQMVEATVRRILAHVQRYGDGALYHYACRLDGMASLLPAPMHPLPTSTDLPLPGRAEDPLAAPLALCLPLTDPAVRRRVEAYVARDLHPRHKAAIDVAYGNIERFHRAQRPATASSSSYLDLLSVETMPGVRCRRYTKPLQAVGMYVPGGSAILPSTALMLAVPAMLARVPTRVLATPPKRLDAVAAEAFRAPCESAAGPPLHQLVSVEILYIALQSHVTHILLAGGAQAIAAMAYGTQTIPKVDKIVGPGNRYVTAAKMILQNDPSACISIDMPAGPSEAMVIADVHANLAFVAADVLGQSEHGNDSQSILVAIGWSAARVDAFHAELTRQWKTLSRRDIIEQAIMQHSKLVHVATVYDAFAFSNAYAPEHLIVLCRGLEEGSMADITEDEVMRYVHHAGSIFVGPYTPESCGDYASGTNHTLPTNGYATCYSGLSTSSFLKYMTSQSATKEGLKGLAPAVTTLAMCEGLDAHANAVLQRLEGDDVGKMAEALSMSKAEE